MQKGAVCLPKQPNMSRDMLLLSVAGGDRGGESDWLE